MSNNQHHRRSKKNSEIKNGYSPFHPWYYVLGGKVLMPKDILKSVRQSDYKGFQEELIQKLDKKNEPHRSSALRQLRAKEIENLKKDISRYRTLATDLRIYRRKRELTNNPRTAEHLHLNLSCKFSHIYNRFAHLILMDEYLSIQGDLFD